MLSGTPRKESACSHLTRIERTGVGWPVTLGMMQSVFVNNGDRVLGVTSHAARIRCQYWCQLANEEE